MGLNDFMASIQVANKLPVTKEAPPYTAVATTDMQRTMGVPADADAWDFEKLHGIVASVYRAVWALSTSIAQLPVQVLRPKDEGFENIIDKPEFNIFRQYNDVHTHFDFWEQVIGYLELTGESPWMLNRNNLGRVAEAFPIRPDLLTVIPTNENLHDHYEFRRGGKVYRLEKEDVFFLKYFNPLNQIRGLSPLEAAKNDLILELNAVIASKETFKSGTRPSGIVTGEIETEEEWDRYRTHFEDTYAGSANYGKILMLGREFKYQQLSLSPQEMQFMEMRQWTKDTVMEVYGVPPIMLMQLKEASILANAQEQYKIFWHTVQTKLTKVEAIITEFLLPEITNEKGLQFKFDLSNVTALQEDMIKKGARFKLAFNMGGVTPNDIREHVAGLERDENPALDLYYLPQTMIPITESGKEEASPAKLLSEKAQSLLYGNIIDATWATIKRIDTSRKETELNIQRIKTLGTIFNLANRHANKFARKLKKLFDGQRDEVLRNLRSKKVFKFTVSDVMFDVEKWRKRFRDEGEFWLALMVKEAGKDLSKEIGETFAPSHPDIGKFVNMEAREYAKVVNSTTSGKLDEIITAGLQEGKTIEEISATIKQYFTAQGTMRANRVARTEMVRGVNKGRLESLKQSKRKWDNMWITQRDERVRDSHAAVDGIVVKAGDPFPVGAGYAGDPSYPSDINERCGVLPVKPKKEI